MLRAVRGLLCVKSTARWCLSRNTVSLQPRLAPTFSTPSFPFSLSVSLSVTVPATARPRLQHINRSTIRPSVGIISSPYFRPGVLFAFLAFFNNQNLRTSASSAKADKTKSKTNRFRASMESASLIRQSLDDVVRSSEDQRRYRALELSNGLKVLLISDPSTDKSSAALDVNIGHMSDPDDIPGLAHFCEHMLFLGTEKYPEENAYSKFLSEHGGESNAFTSAEHTNYYFDVAPEHLTSALDRFAQFFLHPLFTASATEREVNAVHSENEKNLQNDSWRLHQLHRSTSSEGHPYRRFGTGNKETLLERPKARGVDVRDELLSFHAKYYSANLMAVAVLGKESLDELADLVVPLFAGVENKSLTVSEWLDSPYGPDQLKMQLTTVPVKDIRSLGIMWPIPDLHPFYKCNPGHYLAHLIGHEGPGSLLSELKARGWVNTLVGGQKQGAKGFMFFIVNVDLSEEGIEHVDDIVKLTFQYLNMLRRTGPKEWVFRECQDLNAMMFRFKDKERPKSYTSSCAESLHEYPLREVLSGGYLLEEYNPELIESILNKLTPDRARVGIVGNKFKGQTTEIEEWYGTEYSVTPIPDATLQDWRSAGEHSNLQLPLRNEFIATDFSLVEIDDEAPCSPQLLREQAMTTLWFKQDDKFRLPKSFINLELTSPYAYMDPHNTNLTYMFVALLKDALNEYTYDADLAGLSYGLHSTIYGMSLTLRGYNDKQQVLLQKILDKMTMFEIDPQRFEIIKENYGRALTNFRAEQPYQHAAYYTTLLVSEQVWTKDDLLLAVPDLTVERLKAFIPHLLSHLHLEMFVYGNLTRQKAELLSESVEKTLRQRMGTRAVVANQQRRFREVRLPDGCCYTYCQTNEVHKSSSLEIYYQCSLQDTHDNMLLELFCQIISEPCFDILRTKEQLGYIVFSGVRRSNGVQGLRVIVQSDRTPDYVESRIEGFLATMKGEIELMSDEVFQKHKEALATRRLERPKKMSSQNGKFWSEIISQQYNFDRDDIEVAHLRMLTKEEVLGFYHELIAQDASKRHKLSVHIVSSVTSTDNDAVLPPSGQPEEPAVRQPVENIDDVSAFKRGLGLFPLPRPFIQVGRAAKSKL